MAFGLDLTLTDVRTEERSWTREAMGSGLSAPLPGCRVSFDYLSVNLDRSLGLSLLLCGEVTVVFTSKHHKWLAD